MTRSPRKENVKPYSVLAAVVLAVSFLTPDVVVHIPDPLNKMNYKMASDIMIEAVRDMEVCVPEYCD